MGTDEPDDDRRRPEARLCLPCALLEAGLPLAAEDAGTNVYHEQDGTCSRKRLRYAAGSDSLYSARLRLLAPTFLTNVQVAASARVVRSPLPGLAGWAYVRYES
jgi:hypothetical protein